MQYSAGAVYVQILPSLRGMNTAVTTQLGTQLNGVGQAAGTRLGQDIGTGVARGLVPGLNQVKAQFSDVEKAGSASMTTLARGTAPVLDALAKVNPALGRVRDGFYSSTAAASAFSGVAGTVGGRLRSVVDGTNRVGTGFTAMAAKSQGALSRTGSAIGRTLILPLTQARSVLAGYGITASTALAAAGAGAVTMGIKFNAAQEQAITAFTTMLHSGQAAQDFMRQLTDFAARTPFELPGVVSAAQRLMAFGFAAKDVLPTLTAIGDAVAGMGGSAEQINRVTIAIGQMSAKGKVQGDEILQLTEAGIPAMRILANQMGTTTGELQKMVEKGLVPSAKAIPLLLTGIQQGTRGAAGETTAFAGMMANQATTLVGVWSNFKDNFNRAMGDLMAPAMPAIKSGLTWLTDALGRLPALFDAIGGNPLFQAITGAIRTAIMELVGGFRALFAAFRDGDDDLTSSGIAGFLEAIGVAARNVWDTLRPVVVLFGQIAGAAIVGAWRLLATVLGDYVAPAIVAISTWLRPLTPLIMGVATAFATWWAIGTGVAVVAKAFGLVSTAITLVTHAWRLLSLAFVASPIGFIIALVAGLVAGIIYAWNNFEGFRNVVLAVWEAIQSAISFAYNSIIKPVIGALVTAFDAVIDAARAVGAAFSWLWHTILAPIFKILYTTVAIVAGVILTVLVTPVYFAVKLLGAIFSWLWDVAIGPAFRWIAEGATWLWRGIQSVLSGIGDALTLAWTTRIQPILNFFGAGIRAIGQGAEWVWGVILWAWDAIGNLLSIVYQSRILPIFNAVRSAVDAVGSAFQWVYERGIKPAWDAVGSVVHAVWAKALSPAFEAVKVAVRSVGEAFAAVVEGIRIVWDKIKGYAAVPVNFVIETIWNAGVRKIWNAITGWIPGIDLTLGELAPVRWARGGVVPGYAPGRDTVLSLLSPGEAVLVPELVRMLGPDNIVAANRVARGGRGGSGTGPVIGEDWMPRFFLGGLWDGISSVAEGVANFVGDVAGAIGDAAAFTARFIRDPFGTIVSMIPALEGLRRWSSAGWGKAITQLPGAAIGGLISAVKRALGLNDDGKGGPAGGGAAALQSFAHQQRGKRYQWGATGPDTWDCSGLVGALWAVAQGKNPYQRYMTTASMGVGQHGMKAGPGVFTIYLGPGHTAANVGGLHAEAYGGNGVELAIGRVGTPLSYYTQVMHLFAGGGVVGLKSNRKRRLESFLANGWPEPPWQSVMGKPGAYDSGGWLPPGLSTVYNGTGKPEAVFNSRQLDALVSHDLAGLSISGRLEIGPDGVASLVDGRIDAALDATGTAIARRTRI